MPPLYGQLLYWQTLDIHLTLAGALERKEVQLKKWLHEIQVYGIFSISNQWERTCPILGEAVPGLVVYIYRKTD